MIRIADRVCLFDDEASRDDIVEDSYFPAESKGGFWVEGRSGTSDYGVRAVGFPMIQ